MSSNGQSKRHPLKTLYPFIRPYTKGIIAGLILTILANAFYVLGPMLIGRAIDTFGDPATAWPRLRGLAGLIVLVALAGGAARFGMRQLLNGISRRVENDIRIAFFDHLLRMDAAFFAQHRTGDLMSRAVNDIGNIRMAIGPAVMYTVNTAAFAIFSLAWMIRIDVQLTLISIIPMLMLAPLTLYFGKVLHTRYESIQEQLGTLTTMIQENLTGVRIVRAYVQEAAQQAEFERLNREYFDRNMRLARTEAMFNPLLTLLATTGLIIVLIVGGMHTIDGRLSVGNFVMFMYFVGMLTWPMIAIGWVTNLFQRGAASFKRLQAIMTAEPAVQPPADPVHLPQVAGRIEFRNVGFHYPNTERAVLSGVSFSIDAGQTAAIVGPTGSGKSTIVSLLTRRYDATEGEVLIDDVDIKRIATPQLRDSIALVPQDAFVFSETIGDNIALGLRPGSGSASGSGNHADVERVARIAKLDEAVAEFPMGYQTRLGERGVNLSGGQRQRTTLARALARDPRILVLDDALSAVDTHTEAGILQALKDVFSGRTALIISHRVTAVMNADVILVLDHGQIVERGTHAELVERRGLYASLLRRQLLEEELDDGVLSREPARL
jgi:ATP-binding cassette, subfamily B, multidrug efflux pump